MSWNRYPNCIKSKIIQLLQTRQKRQRKTDDQDKENLPLLFCRIPYAGTQSDRLVKNLTEKLKWIISQPFFLKKDLQKN